MLGGLSTLMNLDHLVGAAEIVAALGVIVTLGYLAYQISQTNRVAKSSVVSELMQKYLDMLTVILANTEIAELAGRLTDPSYVAKSIMEKQQIDVFANFLMSIWFTAQGHYDQGQIDSDLYEIFLADVPARLNQWPALKPVMKSYAESYPADVQALKIFSPIFKMDD